MPKSRTKLPLLEAFGGALKRLHEAHEQKTGKKLSHDALARIVTIRIGQRVSPMIRVGATTLWRWEAGEVASPDPLILRELCAVYEVEFFRMLEALETNLKNPKLSIDEALKIVTRPVTATGKDQVRTHSEATDVPASAHARIRELEAALKDRETFIRQVQDAAIATVRLFGADAIAATDRSVGNPKRRSGRARRTAS